MLFKGLCLLVISSIYVVTETKVNFTILISVDTEVMLYPDSLFIVLLKDKCKDLGGFGIPLSTHCKLDSVSTISRYISKYKYYMRSVPRV